MYLKFEDLTWKQQEWLLSLPDCEPYWEKGTRMAKRLKNTIFNVTDAGWLFISIQNRMGIRLATSRDIRRLKDADDA